MIIVPVLSDPYFLHLSGDSSQRRSRPFSFADALKMSIPNLSQLLYHYPPLSKLLCCKNVCLAKDFHSPSSIQVTGSSGCTFKFKSSFKKGCELKIQILRFHILNLLCSTASCNPHVPLGLKAWGTGVLRAEYMWELAGRVLFLRFNAMINV